MKTAAAAIPSYHSAWSLAHGRMAEADAQRSAWLDAKLAIGTLGGKESRKAEHRMQIADAKRKRDAQIRQDASTPRCVICGMPKSSTRGKKCQACHNVRLCRCGKPVSRNGPDCAGCRGKP